jgi:hypothetical protein
MRPVTQRIEGWPYGSCVQAAYATLLGLPIDAVPRFDPAATTLAGVEQHVREREWLASIGYDLLEISTDPSESLAPEVLECIPDGMPHLMSGVSPRGFGHRCVGIGGELAWDPHPSRAGLLTVYSVGFLVPL